MDQIGSILDQYRGGAPADRTQAREHYEQIAKAVPRDVLATEIGPALGELDRDHLERKITASASEMTPEQRGNFLQTLLAGLAGGTAGGSGGLPALLQRIGASPSLATNPAEATPEDVGKVATYARENKPDLFHRAMSFYAEHPTLVKVLGTLAIASIAKRLAGGKRPGLL